MFDLSMPKFHCCTVHFNLICILLYSHSIQIYNNQTYRIDWPFIVQAATIWRTICDGTIKSSLLLCIHINVHRFGAIYV